LPPALFLWFLPVYLLDDPDLPKPVLPFKGGLTTLWLVCLVWFEHSSLSSAPSQSHADAGLLLRNPGAGLVGAEPSITAVLRITPR